MSDALSPIDETCRRDFERQWLKHGSARLEDFLPDASDPRFEETLIELVLIDMEMRYRNDDPPSTGEYHRRFGLTDDARARLARERAYLAGRRLTAGANVGRYELRGALGQGAFAEVWRAYDPSLSREVALKRLRPALGADEEARERFRREALSAAQLRHPAIVTVHEVGDDPSGPFLISDLIEGCTLRDALREKTFAPDEAARVAARIAEALDYAHQFGIVHRDVKPSNVLLDQDGRPLLSDFGLARLSAADATLTRHGQLLGTPAYMSPEQARGDVESIDARSDIYSLGVVLYELLSGRTPFATDDSASLFYAVAHKDVPALRRVRSSVPADLETICLKAMAREPARRYASAGAFADDLRRFLDRKPIEARRSGPIERVALWARRNPALAASVLAIIGIAAIAFQQVLSERTRYQSAHGTSQANLYRSLVRQTEAQLSLPRGAGREAAWQSIGEAATVETDARDPVVLRSLALCYLTAQGPHFRERAAWTAPEGVAALALLPGGTRVVETGPSGTRVRDAATGAETALDARPASALAADPAGRRIAVASGNVVRLLDARDLAQTAVIECGGAVDALAFNDGATRLATGGSDGPVELWDLSARTPKRMHTHPFSALSLAFCSAPPGLVVGGANDELRLIELPAQQVRWTTDFQEPVRGLQADVQRLLVTGWRRLAFNIADSETGGLRRAQDGHAASIRAAFFGPQGYVVTAGSDGMLAAWDKELARVSEVRRGVIRTAAASGAFVLALAEDGRRVLWEIVLARGRRTFAAYHRVAFLPGTHLLFDGVAPFDCRDGTYVPHALPPRPTQLWGIAVDPNGRRAATTSHDGIVELIDARTFARERQLQPGGEIAWTAVFSDDGAVLATGDGNDVVMWDTASGAVIHRIQKHDGMVASLAFLPDGRLVSAARDKTVRLWDAASGMEMKTLIDDVIVNDLALLGDTLAAACDDGTLRVWDDVDAAPRRIDIGDDPLWAVSAGPDGIVAIGSQAGVVQLRDRGSWRLLAELRSTSRLRSLVFHESGRYLVASSYVADGAVWDLRHLRKELASIGLDWK